MAVTDYRIVSYLLSSGTQYINSGVKYTANDRIQLKAKATARQDGGAVTGEVMVSGFSMLVWQQNNYWGVRMYTGSAAEDYWATSITPTTQITLNLNKKVLQIDGTTVHTFSNVHSSSSSNLFIFGSQGGNYLGKYYLYSWEHWTNGTKDRNMVPARRISDSVYGLYDTLHNVFYTNAGTGSFSGGSYTSHTLTLNASTGGTVSGGGTKYRNPDGKARFTATATASSGYAFGGWYSNSSYTTLVSSSASYSSTMTANLTLYAKFIAQYTITATVTPSDGGTVSGTGTYDTGSSVTLVATPNENYIFSGYYVNSSLVSSNASYTFTVTSNTTVEARFQSIYSLTVNDDGNGAVNVYRYGDALENVTLSVIPNERYHFLKYVIDSEDITTTPYTFTMTGDTIVNAYFEEDDRYFISVSTDFDYGSIYLSDNNVYSETSVTIWARPFPDYNFVQWSDGVTANPRTIIVTSDITLVAMYQRVPDTNGIYQYRCYIKDQLALTDPPKVFMRVDGFDIKTDLLTNSNSTITVLDTADNVNNGDVLVLYDPKGTTLYQGVVKSMEDKKITCSQMQSFYKGTWIYNTHSSTTLEQEIAWLLTQYKNGYIYKSSYRDTLVAQRLGGITVDYVGSTTVHLPTDLDDNGNDKMTQKDMEKWIYELYEEYGIVFDFEINMSGANYVHIKVPSYPTVKVGNNMYAIQNMSPITTIEETNRLIIFAQDKTYRTTYVATKNGVVEAPSSTANRFDITNTKIVFSDDDVADLIANNLPDQMYNHKVTFTLVIKNFLYEFGEFNLGGGLDVWKDSDYYNTVLTGYEIKKASNKNIVSVDFTCGKVRIALTKLLTLRGGL